MCLKPEHHHSSTTPGTAGVGKEAILELVKNSPKHIYFTGRNYQAAETVIASCKSASSNITFIPCDQTSLNSVSQAAREFLEKSGNQLDILICNAGVMAIPTGVSKDGYEIQFAINHLAHALLIKLCLPALLKAAEKKRDARIVLLTSLGFKSAPKGGIIFKDLKTNQENLGKWPPRISLSRIRVDNFSRLVSKISSLRTKQACQHSLRHPFGKTLPTAHGDIDSSRSHRWQ
jgi:NAD(P)-dependent dehydrogenase (short-subunit alcohol dehydrogenase family)